VKQLSRIAVLRWQGKVAKNSADCVVEAEMVVVLEVTPMAEMEVVLEVTPIEETEVVLGEVVAAEAHLVGRRSHEGLLKMVAFTNAMEIFLAAEHVPPKKVEPVDLVSEKTGAEDLALVNLVGVQAAVEFAVTEENKVLFENSKNFIRWC